MKQESYIPLVAKNGHKRGSHNPIQNLRENVGLNSFTLCNVLNYLHIFTIVVPMYQIMLYELIFMISPECFYELYESSIMLPAHFQEGYHDKMTFESLLNQFESENSFLGRSTSTYPDNQLHLSRLMKAFVVLEMF